MRRTPIAILAGFLTSVPAAAAAPPPVRQGAPVSSHAMVHTCCMPLAMKERIFAESKAMGARYIRVDVELGGIFPAGGPPAEVPDWARLDEVLELSRRYELPVLGILQSPTGSPAPPDPAVFARMAGEVAAHAAGTVEHWEILNEPDGLWAFQGTPEDYAHILRAAHDAIKARVPEARIGLGALMEPHRPAWLERVFATPGADAVHAFDIANLNLRDTARRVGLRLERWRALLARHGFTGPVWVTENGYPADPAHQRDPAFVGGERAQAAFLTESVLALVEAGASEVFVTLRDNLWGPFLSEGVVSIAGGPPYAARRKPSFAAMRRLVDEWDTLVALRFEQRIHEEAARQLMLRAAPAIRKVRALRALVRAGSLRLARLRAVHREAGPRGQARLGRQVEWATYRLRVRRSAVGWAKASARDFRAQAALHRHRALELAAFLIGP